jgi:predicted aspartyl protease
MDELVKNVLVHGKNGSFRHRAIIDTGSKATIIPRRIALRAGILDGKAKGSGKIKLLGDSLEVEEYRANLEIFGTKVSAVTDVLVPVAEEKKKPEFIVGSIFLQQIQAVIVYKDEHPILSFLSRMRLIGRRGRVSRVPGQSTSLPAETSPKKKVYTLPVTQYDRIFGHSYKRKRTKRSK